MSPAGRRQRRGAPAALAVVLALAAAGAIAVGSGSLAGAPDALLGTTAASGPTDHSAGGSPRADPAAAARVDAARTAGVPAAAEAELGPTLPRAEPVGLAIPAIGVTRDSLVSLGRLPDGRLDVPTDYDDAGWYEPGPAPGQFGPAVIAGHVDSHSGPAVFYRLTELEAGDAVEVARADGTTAVFTVDRVERHAKDQFPTVAVYGNTTDRAELRLITCGGQFDRSTGHYRDNIVVFAHLTGTA